MKLWWIRVLASVWHLAFSPDFMDNCLNKSIRSKQNCRILSISSYKQCDGSLVQAKACCLFGTNFKSSVLEPRLKKQTSNFTIIQIKIHNSLGNHTITPVQVKWLNLEQYMDNCIWISHGFTRYLYYNHNKTKHNKILFTFSRIFRFWPFAKKKKKNGLGKKKTIPVPWSGRFLLGITTTMSGGRPAGARSLAEETGGLTATHWRKQEKVNVNKIKN